MPTGCWASTDAPASRSPPCSRGAKASALSEAFAVQLVHRLRDQDPDDHARADLARSSSLAVQGSTADAMVRDEHQRQGAANVTVRNIITSMRLISDVDWPELFERVSLVDRGACAEQRVSRHGFPDAQSLPQRHRGTGTRRRIVRNSTSPAPPFWQRNRPRLAPDTIEAERQA